jgi:hypothetical protein
MKKVINLVLAVLITGCINAQWSYKLVDNGFDEPYRIATTPINNSAYAYMLNLDSAVVLAITGGYYCDDYPTVDVVLTVNGIDKRFQFDSYKSKSSDIIYITWNMGENPEFVNDFRTASNMKLRINESYCTTEVYTYKMTSSKAAYDYVAKP